MEIIIGLIIIAIGSFCQSSSYVPIKKVKEMELGKFLADTRCIRLVGVPTIGRIARYSPRSSLFDLWGAGGAPMSIFYGILWGSGRPYLWSFHALSGSSLRTKYRTGYLCRIRYTVPRHLCRNQPVQRKRTYSFTRSMYHFVGHCIIGYAGSLRAKNRARKINARQ